MRCVTHLAVKRWQHPIKPDICRELPFCLPHLHSQCGFPSEYCHNVCYGKLYGVATPWCKKIVDLFVCYDRIHERDGRTGGQTDGRTDRRTDRRRRPHLCMASRDKNSKRLRENASSQYRKSSVKHPCNWRRVFHVLAGRCWPSSQDCAVLVCTQTGFYLTTDVAAQFPWPQESGFTVPTSHLRGKSGRGREFCWLSRKNVMCYQIEQLLL